MRLRTPNPQILAFYALTATLFASPDSCDADSDSLSVSVEASAFYSTPTAYVTTHSTAASLAQCVSLAPAEGSLLMITLTMSASL